MKINEVLEQVDLSQRAVKYYEKEGLLHIQRDVNGYRNYSVKDVEQLKKISLYRKLGISIRDISRLLKTEDRYLLQDILQTKRKQLKQDQGQLDALEHYLQNGDLDKACSHIDFESIGQAMQEMVPGFAGYYFMHHFMPYLQIKITTPEQEAAYRRIIAFWDHVEIKIPWFMRLSGYVMYKLNRQNLNSQLEKMETQMQSLLNLDEKGYQKLKEQTRLSVRMKTSFPMRYHPAFIAQRKFMKRLQDCGYNDIFIPGMIDLSPSYKQYHEALMAVNQRLRNDLGLHYDSQFQLVMDKTEK